jgi:hypothetical protein
MVNFGGYHTAPESLTQRDDDFWLTESGVVWVTLDATQMQVRLCVVHWFGLFGKAYRWVTGQGSYFRNTVFADLEHQFGMQHHFTTARCPWANGTVENAMN